MFSLFHSVSLFLLLAVSSADILPFINNKQYQNGDWGYYPAQRFISDPDIIGPVPNVLVEAQHGVSENAYITWAPTGPDMVKIGPQLLDAKTLAVVYQAPLLDEDNFGLSVQSFGGSDYLVFWSGFNIDGRSVGQYHILSSSYELLHNISAVGLGFADCHDSFLTPEGTVVFTIIEPRPYDLLEFGIENGWLMDSYIQEIDIATRTVLFQWRASDHVDIRDSFWDINIRAPEFGPFGKTLGDSWDFFHINSVQKDAHGNFLISSRHFSSIYYIDGRTGDVSWTLGGKRNNFADLSNGDATDFTWQHHARWANKDLTSISLFDDRSCGYIKSPDSIPRGMILELDYKSRTVTATSYKAPVPMESYRKGGMHYLENSNVLLGYGNEPGFTEFAPDGRVLHDVRFGPLGYDRETPDNYRVLKVNWTGNPTWNPKIAVGPSFQDSYKLVGTGAHKAVPSLPNRTAYFSWNGATRIVKWAILASDDLTSLENMDPLWCTLPKAGFETSVHVGDVARYIRAIAVDDNGEALAASPILDMDTGDLFKKTWTLDNTTRVKMEPSKGDETISVQKEWQSMARTTKNIYTALLVGALMATFAVITVLSWTYRSRIARFLVFRGWEVYEPLESDEETCGVSTQETTMRSDSEHLLECEGRASLADLRTKDVGWKRLVI